MESKTISRRGFSGALASAVPAAGRPRYQPRIAAQVYVWTQVFDAQKKPLIGGLPEVYETTRKVGYSRMELTSSFITPETLPVTREQVRKHGLQIPIVYHGGPLHEASGAERTAAEILEVAGRAKSIGASVINTNPSPKPKKAPKTDSELALQARSLTGIARSLEKLGMQLIVHHHDPEMADNAREWRHLLRNTDPKLVGLCIDFDWIIQGGQEPFALLKEAGSRVVSFHLRNARGGVWTQSVAEGEYDYPALARYLRDTGFTGYLVTELAYRKDTEITRPLGENLRLSREYIEKTFSLR